MIENKYIYGKGMILLDYLYKMESAPFYEIFSSYKVNTKKIREEFYITNKVPLRVFISPYHNFENNYHYFNIDSYKITKNKNIFDSEERKSFIDGSFKVKIKNTSNSIFGCTYILSVKKHYPSIYIPKNILIKSKRFLRNNTDIERVYLELNRFNLTLKDIYFHE